MNYLRVPDFVITSAMTEPMLAGLRILAVEQYGAGPFGTLFLADLGAEVIKIENRADGGDVSRVVGPHFNPALPETAQSVFYQGLNRGKKSITLDLARPEGKAVFNRLARHAQAVVSNLRGDVPEKLRITFRHLAAVNPKNLVLIVGAATGVAQLGVPTSDAVAALVVFVVVGSLSVAAPVCYYLLGGERAKATLDGAKSWLVLNNATVMTVLFVVFGVVLISNGLAPLTD